MTKPVKLSADEFIELIEVLSKTQFCDIRRRYFKRTAY